MTLQGGCAAAQSFCFLQYSPSGPVRDAFIVFASKASRQAFLAANAAVTSEPRSPGGFEASPQTGPPNSSRGIGYREFTKFTHLSVAPFTVPGSQKFGLQKSTSRTLFGSIDSFQRSSTYFCGPPSPV